jgi:membrane fusion protein, multidrug efflux system
VTVISRTFQTLRKHKVIVAVFSLIGLALIFVVVRARERKHVAPPAAPLEVDVAQVKEQDVPSYSEWIGTTDGLVNADIRSQVSGYLLRRNYTEGAFVRTGQLLFEIDPRPFEASSIRPRRI